MDDTLSTREYAELHGVSRRTVQRWIAQGLIFAVKIGRAFRIPADEQPPSTLSERPSDAVQDADEVPDITPDEGNFAVDTPDYSPENPFDDDSPFEDVELDDAECRDPEEFETKDRRKSSTTREQAEDYAAGIPVPTEVYKDCSTGRYFVVVIY